jgi:N utilization substance protein B
VSVDASASRYAKRRKARESALQALYECEIADLTVTEAMQVLADVGPPEAVEADADEAGFAATLASGTRSDQAQLDTRIGDAARHWRVERMAAIDRIVLRMAVHEMLAFPATPPRVVINEAIELARAYSGEEAARFVNGVLDGVYQALKEEGRVVE